MLQLGIASTAALGARAEPPIVETAPLYADDFNGYADNTPLVGGAPNWAAVTSTAGASQAKFDAHVIAGQTARKASAPVSEFTEPGTYVLSPGAIGANHYFEVELGTVANQIRLCFGAVNELDHGELIVTSLSLRKYAAGAASTPYGGPSAFAGNRFPHNRNPAAGGRVRVEYFNGRAYVKHQGVTVGATAGYDMSGLAGTHIGFPTLNTQFRSATSFKAGPLSGHIDVTGAINKFYPRIQGLGGHANGARDIVFSGTYSGTQPTGLQWALFDAEFGDTQVKPWARVAGATIGGGAWSATLRVPCGLNGRRPYRLAIRYENDTEVQCRSAQHFYVTYTVLLGGQSNTANLKTINTAVPDHPGGLHYFRNDTNANLAGGFGVTSAWEVRNDVDGTAGDSNLGSFTDALSQALNLPVAGINVAVGGQDAAAIGPGGIYWSFVQNHIAFAGGAFDAIYINQGEGEMDAAASTGAAAWKSRWRDTNIPAYRALSGQPGGIAIPVFFAITGRIDTAPSAQKDANAAILRAAQLEIVSELSDAYIAHHAVGLTMADAYHFTNDASGYLRMGKRLALSIGKALFGGAYDGRGPRATGATRAGATIRVAVDKNGAASIAGTALTSWQVSADDFATTLAISSAAVGAAGTDVEIVLAADPGGPVKVRNYWGHDPDDSSWVIGTYADGSTIAMEPVIRPIATQ